MPKREEISQVPHDDHLHENRKEKTYEEEVESGMQLDEKEIMEKISKLWRMFDGLQKVQLLNQLEKT
jgi:hypothetical protein